MANAIGPRRRQLEAEAPGLRAEKLVRDLDKDARAIARKRIGANRAAMLKIEQDLEAVLDDLVALHALDVGNEAKAAGVVLIGGLVEALRLWEAVGVNRHVTCVHGCFGHGARLSKTLG